MISQSGHRGNLKVNANAKSKGINETGLGISDPDPGCIIR